MEITVWINYNHGQDSKAQDKSRKYQITMASVEPAGIIPNLNRSFGRENLESWSVELSKQQKKYELGLQDEYS